jgi:hypothetical protein
LLRNSPETISNYIEIKRAVIIPNHQAGARQQVYLTWLVKLYINFCIKLKPAVSEKSLKYQVLTKQFWDHNDVSTMFSTNMSSKQKPHNRCGGLSS